MPTDLLGQLRRWPDDEGPDLLAVDPADRLILSEAEHLVEAGLVDATETGVVSVIGDRYGALTLGAIQLLGARHVRAHTDELTAELALAANARRTKAARNLTSLPQLSPGVVAGARLVLLRLPRSLTELAQIVELIAEYAAPDVRIVAGARLKYMSRGMNQVLAERFANVSASLARGKSRVLHADAPLPRVAEHRVFPEQETHSDVGLTICAYGAAFAGTKLDIGTRFLLDQFDRLWDGPEPGRVVDLGCGTGVLAAALARRFPGAQVTATDQSAAAVASAAATARVNGVGDRVQVLRDNVMSTVADGSVDLVVCNPPFHVGSAVSTSTALLMFQEAARVLRPGGEFIAVFNSHLRYRPELTRVIGPTAQIARNPKFTITKSRRHA